MPARWRRHRRRPPQGDPLAPAAARAGRGRARRQEQGAVPDAVAQVERGNAAPCPPSPRPLPSSKTAVPASGAAEPQRRAADDGQARADRAGRGARGARVPATGAAHAQPAAGRARAGARRHTRRDIHGAADVSRTERRRILPGGQTDDAPQATLVTVSRRRCNRKCCCCCLNLFRSSGRTDSKDIVYCIIRSQFFFGVMLVPSCI